ncbi:YdcF family protein [Corynebacterium sp. A21]|uniref:YdcF family protein n=1 Tax=Corynebacterium sp. A21 TaxID=3457318 RepID=UPI003FD57720
MKSSRKDPAWLLVLGTAQYDGRPSRQFAARLDHALRRSRELPGIPVVTVGGKLPGDRFTEAEAGRRYLREKGVAGERLLAVPEGSDTRGSYAAALEQLPWLAGQRGAVITDPLHSRRAVLLAQAAGIPAVGDPTGTSPTKCPSPAWWRALSHETGGLAVVYVSRLFGRGAADRLEDILRRLQARVRPSRRARHEQLRRHAGN